MPASGKKKNSYKKIIICTQKTGYIEKETAGRKWIKTGNPGSYYFGNFHTPYDR